MLRKLLKRKIRKYPITGKENEVTVWIRFIPIHVETEFYNNARKKLVQLVESKKKQLDKNLDYKEIYLLDNILDYAQNTEIGKNKGFVWCPVEAKYFNEDSFFENLSDFFKKLYVEGIVQEVYNILIIWQCTDDYLPPANFMEISFKDGKLVTKKGQLPFAFGNYK